MKTAEHIIETVDKLVRKYHTRDPYELCQLLGIKICVAYNKSTRYRRQNSPVSEREFLKIGKGHVEAK